MGESPPIGAMKFDLVAAEEAEARMTRPGRIISQGALIGIGVIGLIAMVAISVRDVGGLSSFVAIPLVEETWAVLLTIAGFVGFVFFLLASLYRQGSGGPISVDVNADGFKLSWENGTFKYYRWTDFVGTIELTEFREPQKGLEAELSLPFPSIVAVGMTQDALRATVASAKAAGCRVQSKEESLFGRQQTHHFLSRASIEHSRAATAT